ncbi:methyl-accepting chemotaxis protein [Orenia marismortui]|uniref:Methyl-accepting chemotaxis protein n=2 Tax=Orenia marismortui TaxID=46469 RepID=A0A4R8H1G7_9FIRM|nr:methyl-accepting chemotaxis protein [Orenia marismortui]
MIVSIFDKFKSFKYELMIKLTLMMIIILGLIIGVNYYMARDGLVDEYKVAEEKAVHQVESSLKLVDVTYNVLNNKMEEKMKEIAKDLLKEYRQADQVLSNKDLEKLKAKYGVSDLYIIDRRGVLIRSTVEENLNLNLVDAIGEQFGEFLDNIRKRGEFVGDKVALEVGTNKLKKFAYQPVVGQDYIIEIGWYAEDFDSSIANSNFAKVLDEITKKDRIIKKARIFDSIDFRTIGDKNYTIPAAHKLKLRQAKMGDEIVINEEDKSGNQLTYTYKLVQLESMDHGRIVQILSTNEEMKEKLKQQLNLNLSILLLGVVVALLASYFISNEVINPINNLVDKMEGLSDGNLTSSLEVHRKDEFGKLAKSFNHTIVSLAELVEELIAATEYLTANSEELSASSEEAETTLEAVIGNIQEMVGSIEEVATKVEQVSASAQEVSATSNDGKALIAKTVQEVDEIKNKVNLANNKITELTTKSEEIEEIIEIITNIADQTNLLALNASIEAARAGEHGSGFAVVAEEIRGLSEETAQATDKISKLVSEIRVTSQEANKAAEVGNQQVKEGKESIDQAGELFMQIDKAIEETSYQLQDISISTTRLAENSEDVNNSSNEIINMVDEVTNSSLELTKLTNRLDELINRFEVE